MNGGKFARLDIVQTPAGSRSNLSAKMPPFSSESDAAVIDLNDNRDRVLRDSFYGMAWSVIAAVVAITVVVGMCVYSSSDGDKSSAVRNESPQAKLDR